MGGAVAEVKVHGVAVDEDGLFGAGVEAVCGLWLLALNAFLGQGLLNSSISLGGQLVGGDALVEGQESAVARGVGAAMVGAKAISQVSLGRKGKTRSAGGWAGDWTGRWTYIACLGLQLVEAHAILQQANEGVRLDVGGKGQRVRVAHPAARQL